MPWSVVGNKACHQQCLHGIRPVFVGTVSCVCQTRPMRTYPLGHEALGVVHCARRAVLRAVLALFPSRLATRTAIACIAAASRNGVMVTD